MWCLINVHVSPSNFKISLWLSLWVCCNALGCLGACIHFLGWLTWQKFIATQFWRPGVHNQDAGRTGSFGSLENLFCVFCWSNGDLWRSLCVEASLWSLLSSIFLFSFKKRFYATLKVILEEMFVQGQAFAARGPRSPSISFSDSCLHFVHCEWWLIHPDHTFLPKYQKGFRLAQLGAHIHLWMDYLGASLVAQW